MSIKNGSSEYIYQYQMWYIDDQGAELQFIEKKKK